MDPITIGLGLASYVLPKAAKWLFGDDGEKAASEIVGLAQGVTGAGSGGEALEMIKADPALAAQLKSKMIDFDLRMAEEETERLRMVNETMRAESGSSDGYVRRARPTFLYVVAFSILVEVLIALVVVLIQPGYIGSLADLYGALATPQSIAAAMCGVYLKKRSDDKAVSAGHPPPGGLLQALMSKATGG